MFCSTKVKRVVFNKHNNVLLRSIKHYTVNLLVKSLRKVNFLNCECFPYIDAAYIGFLNKLMKLINEVAPIKEIRIKNSTQDWFDGKMLS